MRAHGFGKTVDDFLAYRSDMARDGAAGGNVRFTCSKAHEDAKAFAAHESACGRRAVGGAGAEGELATFTGQWTTSGTVP
jgi:hypothetical protein